MEPEESLRKHGTPPRHMILKPSVRGWFIHSQENGIGSVFKLVPSSLPSWNCDKTCYSFYVPYGLAEFYNCNDQLFSLFDMNIDFSVFLFFFFLQDYTCMEVPGLGIKSELQLPAYTTATATPYLSHICNLRLSLQQHWILNPLSETRDWTRILMDASWVLNPLSHSRNISISFFLWLL